MVSLFVLNFLAVLDILDTLLAKRKEEGLAGNSVNLKGIINISVAIPGINRETTGSRHSFNYIHVVCSPAIT